MNEMKSWPIAVGWNFRLVFINFLYEKERQSWLSLNIKSILITNA